MPFSDGVKKNVVKNDYKIIVPGVNTNKNYKYVAPTNHAVHNVTFARPSESW